MDQDGYSYLYGPVRRGEGEWSKMAIATCMVQLEEEKESGPIATCMVQRRRSKMVLLVRRSRVQDGYSYLYGPVRRGEGEWSKMVIATCMVQLEEEKESGARSL